MAVPDLKVHTSPARHGLCTVKESIGSAVRVSNKWSAGKHVSDTSCCDLDCSIDRRTVPVETILCCAAVNAENQQAIQACNILF